ncbi:MAG: glutathione S-transferase family protein [Pseudomonadota bacterium]
MKIVSFTICPFVQRVTSILEAKNVAYEIEYIELSNKPRWFLEVSPHGQVPVLITDDGRTLFESDAISEYIDEVTAGEISSVDPVKKAQDRAWSALGAKVYLPQCSAMSSPSEEILQERQGTLNATLAKMEERLGDQRFADGDALGMIDLAWISILHRFEIIDRFADFDFLEAYPKLKRWQAALMATGIPEKSVAADFEEKFIAYYLSPKTFLGQAMRAKP